MPAAQALLEFSGALVSTTRNRTKPDLGAFLGADAQAVPTRPTQPGESEGSIVAGLGARTCRGVDHGLLTRWSGRWEAILTLISLAKLEDHDIRAPIHHKGLGGSIISSSPQSLLDKPADCASRRLNSDARNLRRIKFSIRGRWSSISRPISNFRQPAYRRLDPGREVTWMPRPAKAGIWVLPALPRRGAWLCHSRQADRRPWAQPSIRRRGRPNLGRPI